MGPCWVFPLDGTILLVWKGTWVHSPCDLSVMSHSLLGIFEYLNQKLKRYRFKVFHSLLDSFIDASAHFI